MDQYNAFKDTLNTFYKEHINKDVTDAFNDLVDGSIIQLAQVVSLMRLSIDIGSSHPVIVDIDAMIDTYRQQGYVDWSVIKLESIKESKDVVHVN